MQSPGNSVSEPQSSQVRNPPISILEGMLFQGLKYQAQGRFADAERIFRRILVIDPRHAASLHQLGILAHQAGRNDVATELIRAAIGIKPNDAIFHSNLGVVFQVQGLLDNAALAYRNALHCNARFAEAHMNLGAIQQMQGKPMEAAESFRAALAIRPELAEAHMNLGNILQAEGQLSAAAESYERALVLKPGYAEAHYNLGNARHAQCLLDEAVTCFRRAIALKPNLPEAHYNLGNALQAQDNPTGAAASFECALALRPVYAEAQYNLGCALQQLSRLEGALLHFSAAIELMPHYAQARFGLALAQIQCGDFGNGWRNYESRWQSKDHETPMRLYPQPPWNGEMLHCGRLFLWGEQGVGDEVMFAGLIPDGLATDGPVTLECDARLRSLFARSFPAIEVVAKQPHSSDAQNGQLPAAFPPSIERFLAHLPTGSLPSLFRTTGASFAGVRTAYLQPDPEERAAFRARYCDGRRLVGLAWKTSNKKTGRKRSIPLAVLAPLFALPNIRWISLQYGNFDELEDEAKLSKSPVLIDRTVEQFGNLDRFAAQISAMDQVVTIDNSTAHLTGALGLPVWLMLPFAADWRWLLHRSDSPWYPTMRLFRQSTQGEWESVVQSVFSAFGSDRMKQSETDSHESNFAGYVPSVR